MNSTLFDIIYPIYRTMRNFWEKLVRFFKVMEKARNMDNYIEEMESGEYPES